MLRRNLGLLAATALALASLSTPARALRITEIYYHPGPGEPSDLEYIELYNETSEPVDLTGRYFCEGIEFRFEERTILDAGEVIVVARNTDLARRELGTQAVVGDFRGALDNDGERVTLCEASGVAITSVRYSDRGRWPAAADGAGSSLVLASPYERVDHPASWVPSTERRGSPGRVDRRVAESSLRLNELYSATDDADDRYLEIYNAGAADVNLAGYRFAIGDHTAVIEDRTLLRAADTPFLALGEDALGVSLAMRDDEILIVLLDPDDRVVDARWYSSAPTGRSAASIPDGAREVEPAAAPTRSAPNRLPIEHTVVINEIQYHPLTGGDEGEFIEIFNYGAAAVSVAGWRFTSGIRFELPEISVPSGSFLVVAREPEEIRAIYDLDAVLAPELLVGPATPDARADFGELSNRSERIVLRDADGNLVDAVEYHDGGRWPRWADGGGSTLERIDPFAPSDCPATWDASDESSAAEPTVLTAEGEYSGGESELHLILPRRGITLVDEIELRRIEERVGVEATLVAERSNWAYETSTDPLPPDWRTTARLKGAGPAPLGFGFGDEGTNLPADEGGDRPVALFARTSFFVSADDLRALDEQALVLEVEYDDGFAAYLNGVPVARANLPALLEANSVALASEHRTIRVAIAGAKDRLHPGENSLAIEVHNASRTGDDLRLEARLVRGWIRRSLGDNLLRGGDFEIDPAAPETLWRIEGTHVLSAIRRDDALRGTSSLHLASSGSGDEKVNRVETTDAALPALELGARYSVRLLSRWIAGSPTLLVRGAVTGTRSPSFAAELALSVPERLGTPGRTNSVALRQALREGTNNVGPAIDRVRHRGSGESPATPIADHPVTVTARVRDPDGIARATLVYRTGDSDRESRVPMEKTLERDEYAAAIPGQAEGASVQFAVESEDERGTVARFPPLPESRTHSLESRENDAFLVYRHLPARVLEGAAILSYAAFISPQTTRLLEARALHSNHLLPATIVVDGERIHYGAGVRFSGSPFARTRWSGSWRIEFPRDDRLFGEYRSFNLEEHQGGGARDGREKLSHYLLRFQNEEGRTTPFADPWLVRWQVWPNVDGLRDHTPLPNRDFVRRWFPETSGPRFEMDDRHTFSDAGRRIASADSRLRAPPYGDPGRGGDVEEYRGYFRPRGRTRPSDWRTLIDFARVMTPGLLLDPEFDDAIFAVADVDAILRVLAVRLNTDDHDTWGARRGKNAYWYRDERRGWVLLPWDLEISYGNPASFLPPALSTNVESRYLLPFDEVTRFLNRPIIQRRYYRAVDRLVRGAFDPEFLAPFVERLMQAGRTGIGHAQPGGFIAERRRLLEAVLAGGRGEEAPFAIVEPRPEDELEAGEPIRLGGIAPLEVDAVVLHSGEEPIAASVTLGASHALRWRAEIRLEPGEHAIRATALDSRGEVVGVDSISLRAGVGPESFVRGDTDRDARLTVSDAIAILRALFAGRPLRCPDSGDVDDDGELRLRDAIALLEYTFARGAPPAPPFPRAGTDPTTDDLGACAR